MNSDLVAKSRPIPFSVIPADAGIQFFRAFLDPGVRRGDDMKDFLGVHQVWLYFNGNLRQQISKDPDLVGRELEAHGLARSEIASGGQHHQ
jgi:hypothetical protein